MIGPYRLPVHVDSTMPFEVTDETGHKFDCHAMMHTTPDGRRVVLMSRMAHDQLLAECAKKDGGL